MTAWITNLNEITSMISLNLIQVIRLLNCWVLFSPGRVQGAIPVAAYWLGEQIVGALMGNGKGELEERSTVNAGWEAGYDKEVPDVVGPSDGYRRMATVGWLPSDGYRMVTVRRPYNTANIMAVGWLPSDGYSNATA